MSIPAPHTVRPARLWTIPPVTLRCRFCAAPLRTTLRRPRHVAAVPDAHRAEQLNQMEPFYPLHAYVCERASWCSCRSSSRRRRSSPSTRISRRTRQLGRACAALRRQMAIARFGLGRAQQGHGDREQRRLPAAALRRAGHSGAGHRAGRERRGGRRSRRAFRPRCASSAASRGRDRARTRPAGPAARQQRARARARPQRLRRRHEDAAGAAAA